VLLYAQWCYYKHCDTIINNSWETSWSSRLLLEMCRKRKFAICCFKWVRAKERPAIGLYEPDGKPARIRARARVRVRVRKPRYSWRYSVKVAVVCDSAVGLLDKRPPLLRVNYWLNCGWVRAPLPLAWRSAVRLTKEGKQCWGERYRLLHATLNILCCWTPIILSTAVHCGSKGWCTLYRDKSCTSVFL